MIFLLLANYCKRRWQWYVYTHVVNWCWSVDDRHRHRHQRRRQLMWTPPISTKKVGIDSTDYRLRLR